MESAGKGGCWRLEMLRNEDLNLEMRTYRTAGKRKAVHVKQFAGIS